MTLIWIRIRKAAMCGRVPRETQKKSLWLPHRPHTNKHWLQRTTQTDHKCAGAGAVLCLSSRRNTLVGGLLDPEAGARACSTKGGTLQPEASEPIAVLCLVFCFWSQHANKMATQEILYIVDLQQTCTLSLCVSGLFQSQSTCSSTDSYISALHSPILCQFISYIQTFVSCVLELFALIHVCSPTYVKIASHLWLEARSSPAPP